MSQTTCLEIADIFAEYVHLALPGMAASKRDKERIIRAIETRPVEFELALRPHYRPLGPMCKQFQRGVFLAWLKRTGEKIVKWLKANWKLVLQIGISLLLFIL